MGLCLHIGTSLHWHEVALCMRWRSVCFTQPSHGCHPDTTTASHVRQHELLLLHSGHCNKLEDLAPCWCRASRRWYTVSQTALMQARLELASAATFNSCLLNLYRDGRDKVGWHSDSGAVYDK